MFMLSDLIGEVQEVQPVSNISTAADLLKQGAGEFSTQPYFSSDTLLGCSFHLSHIVMDIL